MAEVVEEELGRPVQLIKDPADKGKLTDMAIHIPNIDVSAVDLTVEIKLDRSVEICAEVKHRSET